MSFFSRLKQAKCVAVAYRFNPNGGSCVSINHYALASDERGQHVEKLDLSGRWAFVRAMLVVLFARRLVFNGLICFYGPLGIFMMMLRRDGILYLQESEYALNALRNDRPWGYRYARHIIATRKVACISAVQEKYIRAHYQARRTHLVYNTLPLIDRTAFDHEGVKILMVGYIMPRKGVDLFSKLADYAQERGEKWKFYWIGSGYYRELYHSKNVVWLGYEQHPRDYYPLIDVFFLASIDEPLGLVCSEALMNYRRCVAYENAGYAELIRDIPGCAIYRDYTVASAYEAIKRALASELDRKRADQMLKDTAGSEQFIARFDAMLESHD